MIEKNKETDQRFTRFPRQLLPQKLDDSLESIRGRDLVKVLLHDGRVPNSFETHDH